MARQPLVVFAPRPARRSYRRSSSMRRWFKRRGSRAASAATNPDSMMRGLAVLNGAAILLQQPASAVFAGWNAGERGVTVASNIAVQLATIKPSSYFKAMVPSITVEAAIGTRKGVKRGLNAMFKFVRG